MHSNVGVVTGAMNHAQLPLHLQIVRDTQFKPPTIWACIRPQDGTMNVLLYNPDHSRTHSDEPVVFTFPDLETQAPAAFRLLQGVIWDSRRALFYPLTHPGRAFTAFTEYKLCILNSEIFDLVTSIIRDTSTSANNFTVPLLQPEWHLLELNLSEIPRQFRNTAKEMEYGGQYIMPTAERLARAVTRSRRLNFSREDFDLLVMTMNTLLKIWQAPSLPEVVTGERYPRFPLAQERELQEWEASPEYADLLAQYNLSP